MRQLTAHEILSINMFLQMETNALAMAKAGVNVISDQQLRALAESGISATEGRIKGLQQFVAENNVTSTANAVSTVTSNQIYPNDNINTSDNNLPKGVM